MRMISSVLGTALLLQVSGAVQAATFSPSFDGYSFPGTQFDVDAAANTYYSTNFGISIENAYLYKDSRDTFDGLGIANGNVSEIGSSQDGRINFLDTTDFVTVEYFAILSGTYEAYSAVNALIDSFSVSVSGAAVNGVETLSGGIISYLLFRGSGGYVTVSGLTYNYDGTTDGRNDDIDGVAPVPLPAGGLLLIAALGALGLARRRIA